MPTSVDLSILVCGVHTRYDTFLPRIQAQLYGQYDALPEPDQDRVEIIVLTDNKKMMLGEKRNVMVDMAQGRYVVFVDDDDRISDDYVSALLEATASDADVITFLAEVTLDGGAPKICRYSKEFRRDHNTATEYLRLPNHICCVKRDVSRLSSFPNISRGEDAGYAKVLKRHLRTEHAIDRVLYFYDFDSSTTETQDRTAMPAHRRQGLTPLVDVVILSKASTRVLRQMTQHAIDTCIAGANSLPVNIVVVEQQAGVGYAGAETVYRPDRFHYNRFANDALRAGSAEWVMVANNDLEFTNGWLHNLLAAEHDVVSPRSPRDKRQADITANETGYTNGRHFSGWCFMMRRDLWERLGGFDEDVSFWCSDDAVVEQLQAAGVAPMIVADSIVHHLTSKTLVGVHGAQRDDLTWRQVAAFNRKYDRGKFADHRAYNAWQARHGDDDPEPADEPAEVGQITYAVVAHESRRARAEKLAEFVGGSIFVDDGSLGPAGNHLAVLRAHAGIDGHLVVLEDDAQPHPDFVALSSAWIARLPADLISFYLGTGKPSSYQRQINQQIGTAERRGSDMTKFVKLFHGVCYALPAGRISETLDRLGDLKAGIDLALGEGWREATRRQIVYTLPSLVEHADVDSLHASRWQAPRKAWRPPGQIVGW